MKGSSWLTVRAPLTQALGLLTPAHPRPPRAGEWTGKKAACSLGLLRSAVLELSICGTDSRRAPWHQPLFFPKSRSLLSAHPHRAARRYGWARTRASRPMDTECPRLMGERRLNTVPNRARHSLTTPRIAPLPCMLRPYASDGHRVAICFIMNLTKVTKSTQRPGKKR